MSKNTPDCKMDADFSYWNMLLKVWFTQKSIFYNLPIIAILILFVKVLRFLLPPQYNGGLFVVLKALKCDSWKKSQEM